MCNEKTAGLKDQLFKCFHTSSGPLLGVSGSDTGQSSTFVHLIHSKWDYCKCDLLRWECSLSGACRRQESCSLAVNLPDYYLFYSQKTGHYAKSCNKKLTDDWPFQLSRLKSHIHPFLDRWVQTVGRKVGREWGRMNCNNWSDQTQTQAPAVMT